MKRLRALMLFSLLSQCCLAQHWDSLYHGVNRNITYLYGDTVSDKLYVGGIFTSVNHQTIWGIASWSNDQWDSLGHGIDRYSMGPNFPGSTWGMVRYGNYIYACGNFDYAGYVHSQSLARWDGTNWDSIPGGPPNSAVDNVIAYNNELYISGVFSFVGSISAKCIAKWNGITWQAIGPNYGFSGPISKMIFYHGNLYVAGTFNDPSGNDCHLAKWDGSTWYFFSTILQGGLDGIWDMEIYNNQLIVGGLFYTSTGNAGTSIIGWNDTAWSAVGGSVQMGSLNPYPTVENMCVHNGKLYCVGSFEKIGGVRAIGLASWDGTQWCGYNTFFCDDLLQPSFADQIAFYRDTMYVSGPFSRTDSAVANYNNIARWIGGNYVDTCGVINTGIHENILQADISVFPNPASDNILFLFNDFSATDILITDQLGREIIERKLDGEKQIEVSVSGLADGMYFYQLLSGEAVASGKFIVQH